jgi:hypothetical protein
MVPILETAREERGLTAFSLASVRRGDWTGIG